MGIEHIWKPNQSKLKPNRKIHFPDKGIENVN